MLADLIQSTPEQIGRKLAACAVLSQRFGKTAGLAETAAALKDNIVQGLSSGNPLYTGAAGALGIGGLSAIREGFKPPEKRRMGNVLTAAGIGGAMGAGLPMMGGLGAALPPASEEVNPSISGVVTDAAKRTVYGTPLGVNSALGVGTTTATRILRKPNYMATGIEKALKDVKDSPTGAQAIPGVENSALRSARDAFQGAGKGHLWGQPEYWKGLMDRQIAAREGLPDVAAMQARGYQPPRSGALFDGNNRGRLLAGLDRPTITTKVPAGLPAGSTPRTHQMPMIGGNDAHGVARTLRTKGFGHGLGSAIPAALGIGSDIYKAMYPGQ